LNIGAANLCILRIGISYEKLQPGSGYCMKNCSFLPIATTFLTIAAVLFHMKLLVDIIKTYFSSFSIFGRGRSHVLRHSFVLRFIPVVCLLMSAGYLAAQGEPSAAPTTVTQPEDQRASQTKRILGIVPNFRAVSTDVKLPPQSAKDKFITATEDSFDYSSIFIPAILAGYSMARDTTPEFHQGAAGYGRYFWHAAVDQTSENNMVEFVVPAITHEDTRFYTLGRGGFFKRAGYAMSRVAITRSDSGNAVFNMGEVIGSGASAGLSSLYYPSRERSLGNTGSEWGLDIGIDAASFVFKEFWPDINRRLFSRNRP
jgi:hypothetical protein